MKNKRMFLKVTALLGIATVMCSSTSAQASTLGELKTIIDNYGLSTVGSANGKQLIVSGTKSGATAALSLDIDAGIDVVWDVSLSGKTASGTPLVEISGGGSFEMRGGKIEQTGAGYAICNNSTGAIKISGGTVSAKNEYPIYNGSAGAIDMSGGTVSGITGALDWKVFDSALTISGAGAIPDYEHGCAPWYGYQSCIREVEIPVSAASVGNGAFYACRKLTSIEIPKSVASIGDGAFAGCETLAAINVDADNKNYSSVDGVVFNKEQTAIIAYPAGKKDAGFIIPESVASIANGAFYACRKLTQIIDLSPIPQAITDGDQFAEIAAGGVKLFVSAQSLDAYSRADGWHGFNVATPFTLDDNNVALAVAGESPKTLAAEFDAEYANRDLVWSSSDTSVASVSGGTITAVALGAAIITATTRDGFFSNFCIVNVVKGKKAFASPAAITAVYTPALKLSDLSLPDNYVWAAPATALTAGDSQTFAAAYTDPCGDYETANGSVVVNISKADYDMRVVVLSNAMVKYDGQPHGIVVSGELPDGVSVFYTGNGQTIAGEHTVTAKFMVADPHNYNVPPDMTAVLSIDAGGSTPVCGGKNPDSKHGILLENAVVSQPVKINIKTPEQAQIELAIYDNAGNVLYKASGRNTDTFVWDLTNAAGRNVANGSYLVVVEARGVKGSYAYSAKVGVKR